MITRAVYMVDVAEYLARRALRNWSRRRSLTPLEKWKRQAWVIEPTKRYHAAETTGGNATPDLI